ncbi:hypothetical protein EDB86DRAFT_1031518 [Lactarius hatsudake]|nr:hypothetical protein EDB86DRAFT_1031518 [Lactarius hatsudake]
MKERYICTVVDEIGVLLLVLDGHDPAGPNNQLAGEEVRGFEAEDKWLVFVPSIIDSVPREEYLGMRCGTSAPTMPFRSVGSHQRTIRFLSSALEFSFSFIQPSVTVEHCRLPNVGKASQINTSKRVRCIPWHVSQRTYEGVTIFRLERTKHGLGLLRNAVKPKDVNNYTSDDTFCAFSRLGSTQTLLPRRSRISSPRHKLKI